MKTHIPFLLRFLLPPLYAAFAIATTICAGGGSTDFGDYLAGIGFLTICAYICAGLPALLFAVLLGRFARRRPEFGGRLTRATLMGLVSGLLITAMFGINGIGAAIVLLPLGAAVGFLVEGTIVLLERRHFVAT